MIPSPPGSGPEILDYQPALSSHFRRLNAAWLERWFVIEPFDEQVLSHPGPEIIERGGQVLFARLGDDIVGTCALRLEAPGVYELTKMAVDEAHQGRGIGRALVAAAIQRFRELGGRELYLESNSVLAPALHLYRSLGFEQQPGRRPGSHYARSDVYMIWRDPEAHAA